MAPVAPNAALAAFNSHHAHIEHDRVLHLRKPLRIFGFDDIRACGRTPNTAVTQAKLLITAARHS